jgi:hypothetical protein
LSSPEPEQSSVQGKNLKNIEKNFPFFKKSTPCLFGNIAPKLTFIKIAT